MKSELIKGYMAGDIDAIRLGMKTKAKVWNATIMKYFKVSFGMWKVLRKENRKEKWKKRKFSEK